MAEEKKQETGLQKFNRAITNPKTQEYLTSVLGERKGSFVNNLTALVANNTTLQACEPYTIMFAAMKATALNLPLDNALGFAYVIPYKDNKRKVTLAQFQIGYKGYKQLALRTNQFAVIPNATDIREGELAKRNRLTGECVFRFIDDDEQRSKLPIIGYCSYFRLLNKAESMFYMTKEEMEAHAKRYSQSYRSTSEYVKKMSPWTQDFNSMALKTVLKLNLSKNAPLSIEIIDAINADQAVMMKSETEYEYVDNEESMYDAQKAMEVAETFADFDEIVGDENKEIASDK